METKKTLYFNSKDSEFCYDINYWVQYLKSEKLDSIELFEAKSEKMEDYFFCQKLLEWGGKNEGTCGGSCEWYTPRNGKSGCCKHYSNISYSADLNKRIII